MTTTYGERIKKFRISKGLSQFKLEVLAGIAPGTISKIESNKINPTKETLYRIIIALGLNAESSVELFGLDQITNN